MTVPSHWIRLGSWANLLNEFFSSVFTEDNNVIPPLQPRTEPDDGLANIVFNQNLVFKKLKSLKIKSSPGPDGLKDQLQRH